MKATLSILLLALLTALLAAFPLPPAIDLNLQMHPGPDGTVYISWQEDPAASGYNIYISWLPRPVGDPGWLLHAVVPVALDYYPLPSNPERMFCYIAPVYPDLGSLTYVAGGTFYNTVSNVTIGGFYLDRYEVTQASWLAVMGGNPAHDSGVGPDYPVYFVDWMDTIEYCNRRSIQEGLAPCYSYLTYGTDPDDWPPYWNYLINHHNFSCDWTQGGYRLPTEMEWMFAAKGGNLSQGYTYSGGNDIAAVAWYSVNADQANPVGLKTPNELGLYDMSGNVWEWCWDYTANYPATDQTNPTGPADGDRRIKRGGSFWDVPTGCTVIYRSNSSPEAIHQSVGFRVCRNVPR